MKLGESTRALRVVAILVVIALIGWLGGSVFVGGEPVRPSAASPMELRPLGVAMEGGSATMESLRSPVPRVATVVPREGWIVIRGSVTTRGAPVPGVRLRVLPVAGRNRHGGDLDPVNWEGLWTRTDERGAFELAVPREHYGTLWACFQVPSPDQSFTYFEGVLPIDPEPVIEILDPEDPDWEAKGTMSFEVEPDFPLSLELHASQVSQPAEVDWQLRVLGTMSAAGEGVALRSLVGPMSTVRGAILLDVVDRRGVGVALLRYGSIHEFRDSLASGIRIPTQRRRHRASGVSGCPQSVSLRRLHGPSVMRVGSDPIEVDSVGNVEFVTALDAFRCEGLLPNSSRWLGEVRFDLAAIDWSKALPGSRAIRVEVVDDVDGRPLARATVLCKSADDSRRSDFHEEAFHTDVSGVAFALLVPGTEYEIQAGTSEIAGRVWRSPILRVDADQDHSVRLKASAGTFVALELRGLPGREGTVGLAEICVESSPGSWERRWIGYPMGPYGIFLTPGNHRLICFCDGFGTDAVVQVGVEPRSLTCVLDMRPMERISTKLPGKWIERGVQQVTSEPALPGLGWLNFATARVGEDGRVSLYTFPTSRRTLELWRHGVKVADCPLDARGELVDDGTR